MFILNFQFEQHILFHRASLLQTFHFFNVHSFKAKKVNHFEDYVNFWDMEHQFKKISFITFFIITFYQNFIKLRNIFRQLLCYCRTIEVIYVLIFKILQFFIIIFNEFIISFLHINK